MTCLLRLWEALFGPPKRLLPKVGQIYRDKHFGNTMFRVEEISPVDPWVIRVTYLKTKTFDEDVTLTSPVHFRQLLKEYLLCTTESS